MYTSSFFNISKSFFPSFFLVDIYVPAAINLVRLEPIAKENEDVRVAALFSALRDQLTDPIDLKTNGNYAS